MIISWFFEKLHRIAYLKTWFKKMLIDNPTAWFYIDAQFCTKGSNFVSNLYNKKWFYVPIINTPENKQNAKRYQNIFFELKKLEFSIEVIFLNMYPFFQERFLSCRVYTCYKLYFQRHKINVIMWHNLSV